MGIRSAKELRAVGECLDALLRVDFLFLGDLLMQRMKAIEQATKDGNWTLAQHLELVDSCDVGLATDREKEEAMQAELLKQRLAEGPGGRHSRQGVPP